MTQRFPSHPFFCVLWCKPQRRTEKKRKTPASKKTTHLQKPGLIFQFLLCSIRQRQLHTIVFAESSERTHKHSARREPLDVVVEKVYIERSLDHACCESDPHREARLCVPAVDPVEQVGSPVRAKREDIVRSERFDLACALKQEQLRKDCNGLKPQRERPQDLHSEH